MAGKQKLQRFAEMKSFPNVYEPTLDEAREGFAMKGRWKQEHFKNDNPLVLELGCGKGEYTLGLARKFPDRNYIGMDIKGARIWRGAKTAIEEKRDHVAFLRTRIEFINGFFDPDEVDEIWITFPDPQPKERHIKKRLTTEKMLGHYKRFLKPGGLIHLKTDSFPLYEYTLEVIQGMQLEILESTSNLYEEKLADLDADTQEILSIKTHYEGIFTAKGFSICYLKFKLR